MGSASLKVYKRWAEFGWNPLDSSRLLPFSDAIFALFLLLKLQDGRKSIGEGAWLVHADFVGGMFIIKPRPFGK